MNAIPHVNVDILIVKDGKILLGMPSEKWLQGEEKLWGLPGNDIQFGETFETAVKRNLADLFDAILLSMTVLGTHENFAFGNHYIGIGCLVTIDDAINPQKASDDWDEWQWFSLDSLPENLFEPVKATLEEYRLFLPHP